LNAGRERRMTISTFEHSCWWQAALTATRKSRISSAVSRSHNAART
jgi:hypothetical protein